MQLQNEEPMPAPPTEEITAFPYPKKTGKRVKMRSWHVIMRGRKAYVVLTGFEQKLFGGRILHREARWVPLPQGMPAQQTKNVQQALIDEMMKRSEHRWHGRV